MSGDISLKTIFQQIHQLETEYQEARTELHEVRFSLDI